MINKKYNLKDYYSKLKYDVYLEMFVTKNFDDNRSLVKKSILILPGGGYAFTSDREADYVACKFVSLGYNAYVLNYNTTDDNTCGKSMSILYPNHIKEVMCAVDFLRNNEETYCDKDLLGIIGFSAGGHLAGMYGYDYKNTSIQEELGLLGHNLKPNFLMLIYPVITNGNTHQGSFINLTGSYPCDDYFSIEKNVTNDYPITYIMHARPDPTVPVCSSILMDEALTKNNVKHLTHIFDKGWHGMSICTEEINNITTKEQKEILQELSIWPDEANEFIKKELINVKIS